MAKEDSEFNDTQARAQNQSELNRQASELSNVIRQDKSDIFNAEQMIVSAKQYLTYAETQKEWHNRLAIRSNLNSRDKKLVQGAYESWELEAKKMKKVINNWEQYKTNKESEVDQLKSALNNLPVSISMNAGIIPTPAEIPTANPADQSGWPLSEVEAQAERLANANQQIAARTNIINQDGLDISHADKMINKAKQNKLFAESQMNWHNNFANSADVHAQDRILMRGAHAHWQLEAKRWDDIINTWDQYKVDKETEIKQLGTEISGLTEIAQDAKNEKSKFEELFNEAKQREEERKKVPDTQVLAKMTAPSSTRSPSVHDEKPSVTLIIATEVLNGLKTIADKFRDLFSSHDNPEKMRKGFDLQEGKSFLRLAFDGMKSAVDFCKSVAINFVANIANTGQPFMKDGKFLGDFANQNQNRPKLTAPESSTSKSDAQDVKPDRPSL